MKKIIFILLLATAQLFSGPSAQDKAFIAAAQEYDWNRAEQLLAEGADIETRDSYSCTAIFYAAVSGNLRITTLLVEAGASINIEGRNAHAQGTTPLIRALQQGHHTIMNYLLQKGADPKLGHWWDKHGERKPFVAYLFLQIKQAVSYEEWGLVNVLIQEASSDLLNTDVDGYTIGNYLIYEAIERDNVTLATQLFDQGVADHKWQLWVAYSVEMAQLLLDHGADIDQINRYGLAAISLAALNEECSLVKFLLSRNADLSHILKLSNKKQRKIMRVINVCR